MRNLARQLANQENKKKDLPCDEVFQTGSQRDSRKEKLPSQLINDNHHTRISSREEELNNDQVQKPGPVLMRILTESPSPDKYITCILLSAGEKYCPFWWTVCVLSSVSRKKKSRQLLNLY